MGESGIGSQRGRIPVFGDGDQRQVIRSIVWVDNRIGTVVAEFYISFMASISFIHIQSVFYIYGQGLQEFRDRVVKVSCLASEVAGGHSLRIRLLVESWGE